MKDRITDQELNEMIRSAVGGETPDLLPQLLAELDRDDAAEHQRTEVRPAAPAGKKRLGRRLSLIAAALLVFLGGAFFVRHAAAPQAAAIVGIDVNPSIEISVDDRDRVIECRAVNSDGQDIIDDMDLRKTDIRVASNALVGSMLIHGYLADQKDSVFVSVISADPEKGSALNAEVADLINSYFENASVNAAVMGKYIGDDEDVQRFAGENGISNGRAWLIRTLAATGKKHLQEESLLKMSTQDLILLWSEAEGGKDASAVRYGTVDTSSYITREQALDAALLQAGLEAVPEGTEPGAYLDSIGVYDAEIEFGSEDGRVIYETGFVYQGAEYEFDIDALTGEVLYQEQLSPNPQDGDDDADRDNDEDPDDDEDADGPDENSDDGYDRDDRDDDADDADGSDEEDDD